jgi:hypothetical protein
MNSTGALPARASIVALVVLRLHQAPDQVLIGSALLVKNKVKNKAAQPGRMGRPGATWSLQTLQVSLYELIRA